MLKWLFDVLIHNRNDYLLLALVIPNDVRKIEMRWHIKTNLSKMVYICYENFDYYDQYKDIFLGYFPQLSPIT